MSMVMNLIPLASILFTFTSTVGAALWAAEIEREASFPGETVDVSGEEARKDAEDCSPGGRPYCLYWLTRIKWASDAVVACSLCMREVLGSIPSLSTRISARPFCPHFAIHS